MRLFTPRANFGKCLGVGVLLREAITKEEVPLLDTDAGAKTEECDGALEALGAEACAFGYLTLTVTILDPDPRLAAEKAQMQLMVTRLLALDAEPATDAADALACAICHAHASRLLTVLAGASALRARRSASGRRAWRLRGARLANA